MIVMKFRLFRLLLPVLATSPAVAGESLLAAYIANTPAKDSPWRVGGGYAHLLGLKTEFRGLGTFNSPNMIQPLGGGINRDYDNGYVRVDISNNQDDETWNWSYDDDSQHNPAGSGSINYSITNSLANASVDEDDGGHPGLELFAYYDMGVANLMSNKVPNASWGFRYGLQYNRVDMSNNSVLSTGLTTTTDRFDLGGNIAPLAPFTGSFSGPCPLLSDSPTRATSLAGTGIVQGNRELDLDLTQFSLGTYLELPVTDKFHVICEAGLSLGFASGSYNFQSATTLSGLGTQNSSGSNSSNKILPGAYIGLGATYALDDQWAILVSARYQYMDRFDISAKDTEASLSFDSAYLLSLGCVYSF